MNSPRQRCAVASAAVLLALLTGCGTLPTRTPVFQEPAFNPAAVRELTLLPVIDFRRDKRLMPDVNHTVQKTACAVLKGRHYVATTNAVDQLPANLTEEDLCNPPTDWIRALPPTGARWVMVLAVHDIRRNLTFGSTGNAEVSAYLYDKDGGRIVWHDKGVGQAGQGGLLGMAMVGTMGTAALQAAVGGVFNGLPPRPKSL